MDMPLQTKADARIGKYSGLPLELLVETLQDEESIFDAKTAKAFSDAIQEIFTTNERYHQIHTAGIAYSITLFNGLTLQAGILGNGVSPDNQEWLRRKTNTVKRFGCSSWLRGQSRILKGKTPDDPLLGPEFAAHGGAVPIRVENVTTGPIGAIAVSGLTQEMDHELAMIALTSTLRPSS